MAPPVLVGDKATAFSPVNGDNEKGIVITTIAFAYTLKLYWYLTPYALQKMNAQIPLGGIAVGLHIGPAVSFRHTYNYKTMRSVIGYCSSHINATKRIETDARRLGKTSMIMASENVWQSFNEWRNQQVNDGRREEAPISIFKFENRILKQNENREYKTLHELGIATEGEIARRLVGSINPFFQGTRREDAEFYERLMAKMIDAMLIGPEKGRVDERKEQRALDYAIKVYNAMGNYAPLSSLGDYEKFNLWFAATCILNWLRRRYGVSGLSCAGLENAEYYHAKLTEKVAQSSLGPAVVPNKARRVRAGH